MSPLNPVIHHRVDQIRYVKKEMGLALVLAFRSTLAIPMLDVNLNAHRTMTAIRAKLVFETNVRTHVLVCVVSMPSAEL